MSIDTSEQLLAAAFKLVDTDCKILTCSYVNNADFAATLRTRLMPDDNGSYVSSYDSWIMKFSEVTKTNWIVSRTYPNLSRFDFRKQLLCQHSKKGKGHKTDTQRLRNLDCQASINVVVRKNTIHTRRIDRFMREGPQEVGAKNEKIAARIEKEVFMKNSAVNSADTF